MRTEANVVALDGKFATVQTERTSACEGCHKAAGEKGCSVCSLMGSDRKISARAQNTVGAQVGDRVVIESRTGRMLWYAALVFVLPLVIALVLYALAGAWSVTGGWRVLCALIGFAGTFLCLAIYSKHVQKSRCDIVITEIVKH